MWWSIHQWQELADLYLAAGDVASAVFALEVSGQAGRQMELPSPKPLSLGPWSVCL